MQEKQLSAIKPGQYQYRPNALVPWLNVKVFRESASRKDHLKIRWAGVEFDATQLVKSGEWKPI